MPTLFAELQQPIEYSNCSSNHSNREEGMPMFCHYQFRKIEQEDTHSSVVMELTTLNDIFTDVITFSWIIVGFKIFRPHSCFTNSDRTPNSENERKRHRDLFLQARIEDNISLGRM